MTRPIEKLAAVDPVLRSSLDEVAAAAVRHSEAEAALKGDRSPARMREFSDSMAAYKSALDGHALRIDEYGKRMAERARTVLLDKMLRDRIGSAA